MFGYALERAGNVFVDRTGSDADKSKLKDSVRAVQERVGREPFGAQQRDAVQQRVALEPPPGSVGDEGDAQRAGHPR